MFAYVLIGVHLSSIATTKIHNICVYSFICPSWYCSWCCLYVVVFPLHSGLSVDLWRSFRYCFWFVSIVSWTRFLWKWTLNLFHLIWNFNRSFCKENFVYHHGWPMWAYADSRCEQLLWICSVLWLLVLVCSLYGLELDFYENWTLHLFHLSWNCNRSFCREHFVLIIVGLCGSMLTAGVSSCCGYVVFYGL
jgi:hypothetical protein